MGVGALTLRLGAAMASGQAVASATPQTSGIDDPRMSETHLVGLNA